MSSVIRQPSATFPLTRLRRTRKAPWLRELVRETRLHPSDFILPLFVQEGEKETPVPSLPGVSRLSVDLAVKAAKEAAALGIPAVALFPVVDARLKDEQGTEAYNENNLACRTIRALKAEVPEIGVIADIALDPYTSHGQDGLLIDGRVDNDTTVQSLREQASVLAAAGADILAPSDMMDGRVRAIRETLEAEGHKDTLILAYSAKYASALYGPFRDAVSSAAALAGADKKTYQMDPGNAEEAMREIALDVAEGADMVMVKPALPYLDIIYRASRVFSLPVLAYQVSGEHAMLKTLPEAAYMEALLSIKRAGARGIFTYAARELALQLLKNPLPAGKTKDDVIGQA